MGQFFAGTDWAIDGEDILTDANSESGWIRAGEAGGCALVSKATSAGAATLTVVMTITHVEPGDEGNHALATFSEAVTLVSADTTLTYKIHDLTAYAKYLDRPFTQYKLKVTVGVADCTDVYVGLCRNVGA